jgi:UDP-N-acetylmuramate dehydrogenase
MVSSLRQFAKQKHWLFYNFFALPAVYNASMNILQNVPLSQHSTMRLGGTAAYAVDITSRMELREALAWAQERNLPVMMIGGGSNIIWKDEGFPGLLMINKIMRFEEQQEDAENYYVTVGSGEDWDKVVERTVQKGATGLEFLSLIPGTAGATPVQNVGAYGQEIANVLVSVEAYDSQTNSFVSIPSFECGFGYRTSRFKTTDRGRFFITALTFHLQIKNPQPPFYQALERYFGDHPASEYTPQVVRDAVIAIRSSKLPDPAQVANNGSFFANPIVDEGILVQIQANYPDVPHWPAADDKIKIPAAWLLETAGFKDVHDAETGMGTWPAQPLVLVNEHATSTAQLLQFRQKIIDTVRQKFDITLEQEPEILP